MTYEAEAQVRRTSVGAKVLMFGFAIFAVLGSFWAIVWFIRSYVEPPRVMLPAPLQLASQDSKPVVLPKPAPSPAVDTTNAAPAVPPAVLAAPAAPEPSVKTAAAASPAAQASDQPTGPSVADRWAPMNQFATPPAAAPVAPPTAPAETTPTNSAATSLPASDAESDDVVEGSVPAIAGPAPLPRRKPMMTAAVKRMNDPPLPRPRPDGQVAPQSVWTAVPSADDRYQAGQ
jgi:hypothetical protein